MLCAKAGSLQFCILYAGSLREKTPCYKTSAFCVPRESAGAEEDFQMLHASMRETRNLPSHKLSTGKLRNKEINKFSVWCNMLFFFVLMHLRKKQITQICLYDPEGKANPMNPCSSCNRAFLPPALCPQGKCWVAYNF